MQVAGHMLRTIHTVAGVHRLQQYVAVTRSHKQEATTVKKACITHSALVEVTRLIGI